MAWKNENDEWVTDGGINMGTNGMTYAQSWDDYYNKPSSGSSSSSTKYRTPDGQTFSSEADAQAYMRKKEQDRKELEAMYDKHRKAISDADEKAFQHVDDIAKAKNEGMSCYKQKNWDGMIAAFNRAISLATGKPWEQYKERHRAVIKSFNTDNPQLQNEQLQMFEKFFKDAEEQTSVYYEWLSFAYNERGMNKYRAEDFDGAISDWILSIKTWIFNDQKRADLIEGLGMLYLQRGNRYGSKNYKSDHAIDDYSVAMKLLKSNSTEYSLARRFLIQSYNGRGLDYFMKGLDVIKKSGEPTQESYAEVLKNYKQAYLDCTASSKLCANATDTDLQKCIETNNQVLQAALRMKPDFANLQPEENPAVQKVFDELKESPSFSMPYASTVSNDNVPKVSLPAPQSSTPSSSPAPQPQRQSTSSSASSSSSPSSSSKPQSGSYSSSSYSDEKRGVFLSLVFGVVGGLGIMMTASWLFVQIIKVVSKSSYSFVLITLAAGAVLTFISWRNRWKLFFPLIIAAVFGWLVTFGIIPTNLSSKSATTQSATTNTAPQQNSKQTTTTPEVTGPQFPAEIIGTWKMENSSNEKTMNFTATTWATSGSGIRMTLIGISGDWYELSTGGNYPTIEKLNLKLVNGKLEVREEDPYWSTGTWAKQK